MAKPIQKSPLLSVGSAQSIVRANAKGETIISVAVPIQRFRSVRGALLLSTLGGDIDAILASERWGIVRIFLVSAGVMLLLSLLFAGTIAEPMRWLAEAAERVGVTTSRGLKFPTSPTVRMKSAIFLARCAT